MDHLQNLFEANARWVAEMTAADPAFFRRRAGRQEPHYLFIGCSDSRVPANSLTGALPGELFVHRNIANLVVQTDVNMLSVLQYAVEVLQVRHVIVCGHHGCGGVQAAMGEHSHGLIDNWLRTIKDTQQFYWRELRALDEAARFDRLVELNVIEQINNLAKTSIVQGAWKRGAPLALHGWVFDLHSGRIHPQTPPVDGNAGLQNICKFAKGLIGG